MSTGRFAQASAKTIYLHLTENARVAKIKTGTGIGQTGTYTTRVKVSGMLPGATDSDIARINLYNENRFDLEERYTTQESGLRVEQPGIILTNKWSPLAAVGDFEVLPLSFTIEKVKYRLPVSEDKYQVVIMLQFEVLR